MIVATLTSITQETSALVGVLAALAGIWARVHRNSKKLDTIHVLVNSRLTDALTRIAELEEALDLPEGAPIPKGTP